MNETPKTVAIVGAGIVGVSTAIWLQRAGHNVILIDREAEPGEGTSYGNAGLLASAAIVPVTGPGLIWEAPGMLINPDKPLFLKWRYLPRITPWLVRFLSHSSERETRRIAAANAAIIGDSLADHQALAAGTGAEKRIVPCDYLYVYKSRAEYEHGSLGWDIRRKHGWHWDELDAPALRAYDPVFSPDLKFGVKLPNHGRITDPGAYVKDLAAHVLTQGGRFLRAEVSAIVHEKGGVTGVRAGGETIPCDDAVIATGAWSKPLTRGLGLNVPLEAERGYHLELWEPSFMPRTSVMVYSGQFVMTPMEGRLRLAGIVELGGLKAGPSRPPMALLRRQLQRTLPGLTWKHETEWMGHRPATTDSIPAIGPVPGVKGAWLGYGHQHIGLTGGPMTGRLLAQLISGRTPNIDMAPYDPARF
jgi:D-amino-acid dehydrogenase